MKQVPLEEINILFGGALRTEQEGDMLAKHADEPEATNVEQQQREKV